MKKKRKMLQAGGKLGNKTFKELDAQLETI